jgi:uncharacterized protein
LQQNLHGCKIQSYICAKNDMLISRRLSERIVNLSTKFPIVSVTGPRQSGKTTLLKALFADYRYVSLEDLDILEFAQTDPRGFLHQYDQHVILDEVQRAPGLFNYLQTKVDNDKINGQYILSGSQNFLLMERITQSLAGRVALFKLLPFSFGELQSAQKMPKHWSEAAFTGFFPRLYAQEIKPSDLYPNYFESYVQRDVRQLSTVHDLRPFAQFVRLCAGRIGKPFNYQSCQSAQVVFYRYGISNVAPRHSICRRTIATCFAGCYF